MWILFLLFCSSLLAVNKDPYVLAVTEGEPSANVAGCVNVITGDYFIAQEDLTVQGTEPIHFRRLYISEDGGGVYNCWSFFAHLFLEYHKADSDRHYIETVEPNGSRLRFKSTDTFKKRKRRKKSKKTVLFVLKPDTEGLTNCANGRLGGRTNLKNTYAEMEQTKEVTYVYQANGVERRYEQFDKTPNDEFYFKLVRERLPNGNIIRYEYDKDVRIKEISTHSPDESTCYAWAKIKYAGKINESNDFEVSTSDGQTLVYEFEKVGHGKYRKFKLIRIWASGMPQEHLRYKPATDYTGSYVRLRDWGSGRRSEVRYYYYKTPVEIQDKTVEIHHKTSDRIGCVSQIMTPFAKDHKGIAAYQFVYHPIKEEKHGGTTEVYDVLGNLTIYRYSEKKRLEVIERYQKAQHLLQSERFVWGEEESPDQSNLLARIFFDENGKPIMARRFTYDEWGNVLKETLYGNLSGYCDKSIRLNERMLPEENGVETTTKSYTYTEDDLLQSEEENGKKILYTYLPETNLLLSKLTFDKDQICFREFFEYNHHYILIRSLKDDGISFEKEDLTGVTQRLILEIIPRNETAFNGMPDTISEKALDVQSGKEKLLKKIKLHYSPEGRITQKSHYNQQEELCYTLYYTYDEKGRLIEETNPIGEKAKTTYTRLNQKASYQDFHGQSTQYFSYNTVGHLIATEEVGLDHQKRTTQFLYDYKGQLIRSLDSYGHATEYTYDALGRQLTKQTLLHTVESLAYDAAGNKIQTTNAAGATTQTTFNTYGKPTSIVHPNGATETFTYNLDGSLQKHVDPEGTQTLYTYDSFGHVTSKQIYSSDDELLSEEKSTYNAFHLLSHTNPSRLTTTYTYDEFGRKIAQQTDMLTTTYAYDDLGFLYLEQTENTQKITQRDLLGRITKETICNESEIFQEQSYTYDHFGNKSSLTRFIDSKEATEHFLYDSFNRPIRQIDPLGRVTEIHYNDTQNQKTYLDPSGLQTLETYDSLNHLITKEKKNSFGEKLLTETYEYDPLGNRTSQTTNKSYTILWEYSSDGKLLTLTEAAGTPQQKITHYTYTPRGQVHKLITPLATLTHTYDPLGHLISLTSSDGTIDYTMSYDPMGRLLKSTDKQTSHSTTRTYDPLGRLIRETLANGQTLQNSYDTLNRRISLILPDLSTIQYTYDDFYLRAVTRTLANGQELYTHHYTHYDTSGNLLQENHILNLGTSEHHYNLSGRQKSQHSPSLTQKIEHFNANSQPTHVITNHTSETFTYDTHFQLTEEKSHRYTYDGLHNRLSKDDQPYSLNVANQLISHHTYDENGNPQNKESFKLTYDALGRLTSAENSHKRLIFTYDSLNRRINRTTYIWKDNQWITHTFHNYLYDGQNEIGATDRIGYVFELRVLGLTPAAEIGAAIAIELGHNTYLPIHNLFGHVHSLIDQTGQVAESYSYTAFGENPISSKLRNPWGYCSKRFEPDLNLYYFGRRYYDPETGRFLTPDPAGFIDSHNLYTFTLNDPLTRIDLYGLSSNPMKLLIHALGELLYHICRHMPDNPLRTIGMLIANIFTARPMPLDGAACCPPERVGTGPVAVDIRVMTANGVLNDHEEGRQSAEILSESMEGKEVGFLHNNTQGLSNDIIEAGLGKIGFQTLTGSNMLSAIQEHIEQLGGVGKGIIYLVLHSAGGADFKNILKYLTPEEKQMLHVRTIGSADFFRDKELGSLRHYVSSKDPILLLSPIEAFKAIFRPEDSHITIVPSLESFPDHAVGGKTYSHILWRIGQEIISLKK